MGEAVGEVGGAVDGVDHPQAVVVVQPEVALGGLVHFFAEHGACGDARQGGGEGGLRGEVGFSEDAAVGFFVGTDAEKARHHFGAGDVFHQCL